MKKNKLLEQQYMDNWNQKISALNELTKLKNKLSVIRPKKTKSSVIFNFILGLGFLIGALWYRHHELTYYYSEDVFLIPLLSSLFFFFCGFMCIIGGLKSNKTFLEEKNNLYIAIEEKRNYINSLKYDYINMEKNFNSKIKSKVDKLYDDNKKAGIIGVSFVQLQEGKSLKDFALYEHVEGYNKYIFRDELFMEIDSSLFGNDNYNIGFFWEGVFVKKEDMKFFDNNIIASKKLISNNGDTIKNSESFLTKNYAKLMEQDEITDYFKTNNIPIHLYNKYASGIETVKQINYEYAKAALTVNLIPDRPMSSGTATALGGALGGGAGAIIGYMDSKNKQENYKKEMQDYFEREYKRNFTLNSEPMYVEKKVEISGKIMLLNLPMGLVPLFIKK